MKLYLASRYGRKEEISGYRDQLLEHGHLVTSSWIDETQTFGAFMDAAINDMNSDEAAAMQKIANIDLLEIQAADALLAFTETPESEYSRGGRHVEMGYAIGRRKPVFLVGPRENLFCWLPSVRQFKSFAEALANLEVDT